MPLRKPAHRPEHDNVEYPAVSVVTPRKSGMIVTQDSGLSGD